MQLFSNNCSRLSIMGKTKDAYNGNVKSSKANCELTETETEYPILGVLSKLQPL